MQAVNNELEVIISGESLNQNRDYNINNPRRPEIVPWDKQAKQFSCLSPTAK